MILFRDSGKTLLVLDDFHVSRRTDDFRVSHLEKKVFVLFFNCKTNLRRLTWKSSRYIKILIFLQKILLDDLRVSRSGKVKFLTQSDQMQN